MNAPLPKSAQRYSLAEIAHALNVSKQAAQKRANKEAWPSEQLGRGRAYPALNLPKEVVEAIALAELNRTMSALAIPSEAHPVACKVQSKSMVRAEAAPPELGRKQLDCERARDRILTFVSEFPGSIARAIDHLNAERHSGRLVS